MRARPAFLLGFLGAMTALAAASHRPVLQSRWARVLDWLLGTANPRQRLWDDRRSCEISGPRRRALDGGAPSRPTTVPRSSTAADDGGVPVLGDVLWGSWGSARRRPPSPAFVIPPRPRGVGRASSYARVPAPRVTSWSVFSHLVDPGRLEMSAPAARRAAGVRRALGRARAGPTCSVDAAGDSVVGLARFPTTGHACHHPSFLPPGRKLLHAGTLLVFESSLCCFVNALTPPPEVDLEAWQRMLDEPERRRR